MEKYTKFADKATGINPFVPPKSTRSFLSKALKFIYGPILILIRLPCLLVIFFMLYLYHNYLKNLILVKELRRMINLFINLVLFRVVLFFLGYYTFKSQKHTLSNYNIPNMGSGFIVLSNHSSPIDIIYLSYIMSPTFAKVIYRSDKKEIYLSPLDFMQSLKLAFNLRGTAPITADEDSYTKIPYKKLNTTKLGELQYNEKEGPIVIFFEGVTTNGEGVLEINEDLAQEIYNYKSKYSREPVLVSFKYHDQPSTTVSNPFWTILSLMANLYNSVTISMTIPSKNNVVNGQSLAKEINLNYTTAHQMKSLHLTHSDYANFLDYWNNKSKKNASKND